MRFPNTLKDSDIACAMDKLKTLKTTAWERIESQAEAIHGIVSKAQQDGKGEVRIKGDIHKINKVILETNGFTVHDRLLDYSAGGTYFEISWR